MRPAVLLPACFAALAATACWIVVFCDVFVRGDPRFWLLVLPFCVWWYLLSTNNAFASKTLGLSLVAWPVAGAVAVAIALALPGWIRPGSLASQNPFAPGICEFLAIALAIGSAIALRSPEPPRGRPPMPQRQTERPAAIQSKAFNRLLLAACLLPWAAEIFAVVASIVAVPSVAEVRCAAATPAPLAGIPILAAFEIAFFAAQRHFLKAGSRGGLYWALGSTPVITAALGLLPLVGGACAPAPGSASGIWAGTFLLFAIASLAAYLAARPLRGLPSR